MSNSRNELQPLEVQGENPISGKPLLICFVHGTFQASFPLRVKARSDEGSTGLEDSIPDEIATVARENGWSPTFYEYVWGPGKKQFPLDNWNNNEDMRWEAARGLRDKLSELKAEVPGLTIMTVGHSHGGRVSVMANCLGEEEVIDQVVGLSSPYFEDLSESDIPNASGKDKRAAFLSSFAVWKIGIFILLWSICILLFGLAFNKLGFDPWEKLAEKLSEPGDGSFYSIYAIYSALHLATAVFLSVPAIYFANRKISEARLLRRKMVDGQKRGEAITLDSSRVVAFINARDEVQQYLGFQQRMIGLAASITKVTPLLLFCACFLAADELKHGDGKLKSGWVAKVAGRLESSNLMPDYDLLATRDDRFVISEELLEKALRLKGAKPLAYTKAAYALKALHLALCLTVLMEAFRWLMALFSTTQFGLGGRMSWILAGGIRLRRGPGTNFTGYEVVTDFSSCTLKDLRELVSNGHGALLRDAKSRRHWMESALMTLKQAPPAPLPVAQEQLDLALSSPCSAAVEARLDKKI